MSTDEFSYRISVSAPVIVFLLLFALRPAGGQFHVVGPLQPITAAPGDDVILPCHVEPKFNVAELTVEWSKPDLRPDPNDRLSRVEYVHLYRDAREVPDMKLPSYIGRTELFTDGLREGNISLRITNVTLEDEGRYRCFIPKLKSQTKSSVVRLIVDPSSAQTGTTETPLHPENFHTPEERDTKGSLSHQSQVISLVVFCVLILLCVAVGGYLFTKSKSQKAEIQSINPSSHLWTLWTYRRIV
ncbi:myelin-oligodendrocyte glycoprotein-like [Archocentrus centrarchus]|uniref:myelin-oligodendrocyte glycoprotein-like n=1 Tax=Archocentrus centrarchus TaxID=63155 RepID=UPI0011E9E5F9|nr:myelin-oligodendrocyte glycoprotein-like [Archocentrus centrarchus]